jgi:hypothetical protein
MNQEPPSTIARAKACGANVRAGRITFPSVEALESFARAWQRDDDWRRHEAEIARVEHPEALPVPVSHGGPEVPFGVAVDAYVVATGTSRAECFRRISAVTGNSPNGISLRYTNRPGEVWRFAG